MLKPATFSGEASRISVNLFRQTNKQASKQNTLGSLYNYSQAAMSITSDTYELCRPLLCILFHASTLLPRILTPLSLSLSFSPYPLLTFSLPSSSPSIHLCAGASQRGSACCVRGILGLWRQFGNEARLHLNTLLSGHLVNLMSGGWWRWWCGVRRGREGGRGGRERKGE